jgi:glycosyltransferase involved in cell wall biosynthesis
VADVPKAEQAEAPELRVSVLVVSHNCAGALRKCMQALESSPDRGQIEILVVDNGSDDGSQSIDHEFPDVNALRLPHYCGLTRACNIGIRTAKAEYLLLLSPDVILPPGGATKLANRLAAEPAALAVCPDLRDELGRVVSRTRQLPDASQVAACWRDPVQLPDSAQFELHDGKAILMRKHTIQGINYLDSRYGEHWADVDLAYEISRAGKKIVLASEISATLNTTDQLWKPVDQSEEAAFAADAANGAAAYLGKHFGFGAGLGFRIRMVLATLAKLLTFQRPGYQMGLLSRLLSGYKIDGKSQKL